MDIFTSAWLGIASYFGIKELNKLIKEDERLYQIIQNKNNFSPEETRRSMNLAHAIGFLKPNMWNKNEFNGEYCVQGIVKCDDPLISKIDSSRELVATKYYRDSIKLSILTRERLKPKKDKAFVRAVPFVLKDPQDKSTIDIKLTLGHDIGQYMEKIGENRHLKQLNFKQQILSWLFFTRIGWIENEYGLTVGTPLFAFGDVIYNTVNNTIRMENPYLLVKDKAKILNYLSVRQIRKNIIKIILGSVLIFCSGYVITRIISLIKNKKEKARQNKMALLREKARQNQFVEKDFECIVCTVHPRNIITIPCYHMIMCFDCYKILPNMKCPVCKTNISKIIEVFPKIHN